MFFFVKLLGVVSRAVRLIDPFLASFLSLSMSSFLFFCLLLSFFLLSSIFFASVFFSLIGLLTRHARKKLQGCHAFEVHLAPPKNSAHRKFHSVLSHSTASIRFTCSFISFFVSSTHQKSFACVLMQQASSH